MAAGNPLLVSVGKSCTIGGSMFRRKCSNILAWRSETHETSWNTWCMSLIHPVLTCLESSHQNDERSLADPPRHLPLGWCKPHLRIFNHMDCEWKYIKTQFGIEIIKHFTQFPMIVGKDLQDVCVVCAAPGSMIGSVQAEYNPLHFSSFKCRNLVQGWCALSVAKHYHGASSAVPP